MTQKNTRDLLCGLGAAVLALSAPSAVALETRDAPLESGSYFAPLASYRSALDDSQFKDGYGAAALFGFRDGVWAMEAGPVYQSFATEADEDATVVGFTINGLLFPFQSLPRLYGSLGFGAVEVQDYPDPAGRFTGTFPIVNVDAGLGYLFPIQWGNYEFAVRAEARYQYGTREERLNAEREDVPAPRDFKTAVANLGLHLPLANKRPPPPPPAPAQVVPPVADADSDHDGVLDAVDECPGTAPDTPVDDVGCALPPPPPPPPPCRTPEPGERVSLAGCGTGDVIVLRGVNFALDSAELDPNTRTLLDDVVSELNDNPQIHVQIVGHTDAQGSDQYNLMLSDERARAVMDYLVESGISADRLTAIGMGEAEPIESNDTAEGRALNRRVELKITQAGSPDED
ncbi:OmpA family protein [Sinimarinibacterium thermocellulolyticum]|uniref:OmpA family protein n=1 Tax=Sinimarinibacterium thermocellulolyticum TaxID=3170016 RepID=A0ABV2AA41_9GAMM